MIGNEEGGGVWEGLGGGWTHGDLWWMEAGERKWLLFVPHIDTNS